MKSLEQPIAMQGTTDGVTGLHPLTFGPIYKEKVWGGRVLSRLGRVLPGGDTTLIGESWELADLSSTSVSGGGGSAEHSVVADGPLAGKTIRELVGTFGEALLGKGVEPAGDGGFPLLVKFLDARQNLSVQVHPSPGYAAKHVDAYHKSEAWYIVDAEPGAVIYKGLAAGTTPQKLRAAIETNTDEAVLPLLCAVPVRAGDCHYMPSGTLHALGAGVVVAEVQTPSDTTFRVYDWGRTSRELHIEQALSCINFGPMDDQPRATDRALDAGGFASELKACCDYFQIDAVSCDAAVQASISLDRFEVWVVLRGGLVVDAGKGSAVSAGQGKTLLMPASLGGVRVSSASATRWLRVSVPER